MMLAILLSLEENFSWVRCLYVPAINENAHTELQEDLPPNHSVAAPQLLTDVPLLLLCKIQAEHEMSPIPR